MLGGGGELGTTACAVVCHPSPPGRAGGGGGGDLNARLESHRCGLNLKIGFVLREYQLLPSHLFGLDIFSLKYYVLIYDYSKNNLR
jgi:hypothetical protein